MLYMFDYEEAYGDYGIAINFNKINHTIRHKLFKYSICQCYSDGDKQNVDENIEELCHKYHTDCDGVFHYSIILKSDDELQDIISVLNSNGYQFDREHTYFNPFKIKK